MQPNLLNTNLVRQVTMKCTRKHIETELGNNLKEVVRFQKCSKKEKP